MPEPTQTQTKTVIDRIRASERFCEQEKEKARRDQNWRMFFFWMGYANALQKARNFIEEANGA